MDLILGHCFLNHISTQVDHLNTTLLLLLDGSSIFSKKADYCSGFFVFFSVRWQTHATLILNQQNSVSSFSCAHAIATPSRFHVASMRAGKTFDEIWISHETESFYKTSMQHAIFPKLPKKLRFLKKCSRILEKHPRVFTEFDQIFQEFHKLLKKFSRKGNSIFIKYRSIHGNELALSLYEPIHNQFDSEKLSNSH